MTLGLLMDSSKLQLMSLDRFASALGYQRHFYDVCYYSSDLSNLGRCCVSFSTMVRWHNDMGTMPYFSLYRHNAAFASRIVCNVKLQMDKKRKRIIPQSHVVEFVYPEYYEEFAKYLVKPV